MAEKRTPYSFANKDVFQNAVLESQEPLQREYLHHSVGMCIKRTYMYFLEIMTELTSLIVLSSSRTKVMFSHNRVI